jgi:flagellar hook-associated protein 1 FlgK
MLGLFGILNLGARSLQTQQQGIEVAGQNLANVNNPAYARQRVAIQTSLALNSELGPQGTGADAVAIVQLRSGILDQQLQSETSVRGSLEAQQRALQYAQADLGTQIDRLASGSAAPGVGGAHSLADRLSDLFNSFQSLSANPTSMAERQTLLMKAVNLTAQFNQMDLRLGGLKSSLDQSVQDDVASANQLLADIARLNDQIGTTEATANGVANDLRDLRQQKIENLAKLVKIDVATGADGAADIAVAGTSLVSGNQVVETLQAYDAGGGQILVRATTAATPLTLTGGSLQGTIDTRDGALTTLRTSLSSQASLLISEVNATHAAGFSLTGSTGANFFTGTNASDIAVNASLLTDPSLLQASGVAGAVGDNQVALALAQLADKKHAALNGQTFGQGYGQTVAALGQSLASVNTQLADQQVVENMLSQQRSSISGVSLDEEMTDLTKFQKAFTASARLITTVDDMLDTIVNMKR